MIDSSVVAAAHSTAIVVDRSELGLLKISGETRLDLIDRMSTQSLRALNSGQGAATVLTTDIGRIIDRLILYATSDTVYALTGEQNSDNIARYLMGYVFFNDDFHLQDISSETTIFAVYGPQAAKILGEDFGFPDVDLPLHHWREADVGGVAAYLHRTDPIQGQGFFVMCESKDAGDLHDMLHNSRLVPADQETFEYLRIEAGLPRFGQELTQDYIPLETGLWDDVSFNKGCYIGQEIIARMESRGRLAKQLVILQPDGPIAAGAEISAEGKRAGTITSAVSDANYPIALGYVKTSVLASGAPLVAGSVALQVSSPSKESAVH